MECLNLALPSTGGVCIRSRSTFSIFHQLPETQGFIVKWSFRLCTLAKVGDGESRNTVRQRWITMKKQQPVCVCLEDNIEQRANTEIFVKRLTRMALDKSDEHIWSFKIAQNPESLRSRQNEGNPIVDVSKTRQFTPFVTSSLLLVTGCLIKSSIALEKYWLCSVVFL